jgi:hypothetical protein
LKEQAVVFGRGVIHIKPLRGFSEEKYNGEYYWRIFAKINLLANIIGVFWIDVILHEE